MVTIRSKIRVQGVSAEEILGFMLHCTDETYQAWWPGTHLAFHTLQRCDGEVGNIVYFDEYIGNLHLVFKGIVTEYIPGRIVVWQMTKGFRLPAWLVLECQQDSGSLLITHTLSVGFKGLGRIFDPLIRLLFTEKFCQVLDEHAQTEFPRLAELLIEHRTSLTDA